MSKNSNVVRLSKRARAGRPMSSEVGRRVDAILDVATSVFLEEGYAAANIDEIVRRAGASKTTLYARFPTKASLFKALVERRTDEWFLSDTPAISVENDGTAILFALCREWMTKWTDPSVQRMYLVITAERENFPELVAAYWQNGPRRALAKISDVLTAEAEAERLVFDDVEWAAEQLLGALMGMFLARFTLNTPSFLKMDVENVDRWIRSVLTSFLRSHAPEPLSRNKPASIQKAGSRLKAKA